MRSPGPGIAAVWIGALVLAAGATAKPTGLQTVKSKPTIVTGANSVGFANATCAKGSRAVSGGYRITPPPSSAGGPIPVVFESRGAPRGWSVGMANLTAGTTTLRSFVYCRSGKPRLREFFGTATLAPTPRAEATATATCPKGMRAFSGGFHAGGVLNGAFAYITRLGPLGARSWTLTVVRNDVVPQGSDQSIGAFVFCGRSKGGGVKTGTASATTSPAGVVLSATTRKCARNRLATGGGFIAPYIQSGFTRENTLVTELRRTGRRWRAFGLALGSSGLPLSLTAITRCR